MKFSVNNKVQLSLLIRKVWSQQQRWRSACSLAKSCANNDGADQPAHNSADQPAHLHSLRLAFGMLTNVGPTKI